MICSYEIQGWYFSRTRLDEDPNLFCFFLACPPQIPRGGGLGKLNIWVFSAHGNTICGLKGNQVQILNDPVTVSGEAGCKTSLCETHEKAQPTPKIRKSGSLLRIEVHSFRRK